MVPSLDYKPFHTSTTPTIRGRTRGSPGSTPPRTMWNPTWSSQSQRSPGRIRSHARIRSLSVHVQLQQAGVRKLWLFRVDTATHDVDTPTWGSWSHRHLGRIKSHARIRNASIHLQLQQTSAKLMCPRATHDVETPTRSSWSQPAPPRANEVPSPDHSFFHPSKPSTNRGAIKVPPPRHYRHARCGKPNLGLLEPAAPGDDKVPFLDYKPFHRFSVLGTKGVSPGSIPPRTLRKPQPGLHRASATWAV